MKKTGSFGGIVTLVLLLAIAGTIRAEERGTMSDSTNLNFGLGSLPLVSDAKSRSISAENPTGEVGGITYPPTTPPPTDIPSGPSSPTEWGWRLALLALVAVQAVALKLIPRLLGIVPA